MERYAAAHPSLARDLAALQPGGDSGRDFHVIRGGVYQLLPPPAAGRMGTPPQTELDTEQALGGTHAGVVLRESLALEKRREEVEEEVQAATTKLDDATRSVEQVERPAMEPSPKALQHTTVTVVGVIARAGP